MSGDFLLKSWSLLSSECLQKDNSNHVQLKAWNDALTNSILDVFDNSLRNITLLSLDFLIIFMEFLITCEGWRVNVWKRTARPKANSRDSTVVETQGLTRHGAERTHVEKAALCYFQPLAEIRWTGESLQRISGTDHLETSHTLFYIPTR